MRKSHTQEVQNKVFITVQHQSNYMKENDVDDVCGVHEGDEKFIHSLGQKITKNEKIWELDDHGSIILKWTIKIG